MNDLITYTKVYQLNVTVHRNVKRRSMTKYEEDRKIRIIEEYIDGNEWIPPYSAFLISSVSVSVKPFRLVYPHKLRQVPKVIEEITNKINGKSNVEIDIKYFPIQIPTQILLSLLHDALIKKKARFNQIKNDPFKKEHEKQLILKQLETTINDIQTFINYVKQNASTNVLKSSRSV